MYSERRLGTVWKEGWLEKKQSFLLRWGELGVWAEIHIGVLSVVTYTRIASTWKAESGELLKPGNFKSA